MIYSLLLILIAPAYLFSLGLIDWQKLTPKAEEIDFKCPHHCGEWGSDSIRHVEWEFVQCLYDVHDMTYYIQKNLIIRDDEDLEKSWKRIAFVPKEVSLEYTRPENRDSSWYQSQINQESYDDDNYNIFISDSWTDEWNCYGSFAAFWFIKDIAPANGTHVGKYFSRHLLTDIHAEYEDEGMNFIPAVDANDQVIPHPNSEEFLGCYWRDLLKKDTYCFGNFIDFHNACDALETDLLRQKENDQYRHCLDSPFFNVEIKKKYSNVAHSLQKVRNTYNNIFLSCAENHDAPSAYYNLALNDFHKGEYFDALENLTSFLDKVNTDSLQKNLASTLYQSKGALEVEVEFYDDAILSLGKAISLNPKNKEAYFDSAISYFEKGEFDSSLKNYLASECKSSNEGLSFSIDYGSGLIEGMKKGMKEEFGELLPAWAPLMSIGLWALTTSPQPQAKFVTAALSCVAAAGTYLVADQMVSELKHLVTNWKELSERERGELTGYVIGKYGIDYFAIIGSGKVINSYRDLKRANQLLNFEVVLANQSNLAAIKTRYKSIEKFKKDQEYIKNTFKRRPYPEHEIRDNLQKMGYKIPQKPEGIPDNFITRYSDKNCGISYHDPMNPNHEYIRLMPGNPHSPNPAQQQQYIVQMSNGKAVSASGNLVETKSLDAHIPPQNYIYRPSKKE